MSEDITTIILKAIVIIWTVLYIRYNIKSDDY